MQMKRKAFSDSLLELLKNEYFVQWIVSPTEESSHFWSNWQRNHPGRVGDVEKARQIILSAGYQKQMNMPENDYSVVLENIVHYSQNKKNKLQANRFTDWRPVLVAACVLMIVVCTGLLYTFTATTDERVVLVPNIIEKQNPRGQKSSFLLPDGTKVFLNSESTITYLDGFEGEQRKIQLSGEAFFEVVRDEQKPFVVETKNLTTTALGTSFNVDAYPNETEEVVLVSGKVKVNKGADLNLAKILLPGEMAAYENGTINKYHEVDPNLFAWKDGVIVFQQTAFNQGIKDLERWFGVEIEIKNMPKGKDLKFTGTFKNQSLSNVLQSMSFSMRFDFKITGKEVLITF